MSREIWIGIAIVAGGGAVWAAMKALWTYAVVPYIFRPVARNLGDAISERIHDRDQEFFTELLDARLAPIRRELQLNGGDSLKDLVVKLREQMRQLNRYHLDQAKGQEQLEHTLNRFVEESELDREGIWAALSEYGIDRRNNDKSGGDR